MYTVFSIYNMLEIHFIIWQLSIFTFLTMECITLKGQRCLSGIGQACHLYDTLG